jgi:hypothetical protein
LYFRLDWIPVCAGMTGKDFSSSTPLRIEMTKKSWKN